MSEPGPEANEREPGKEGGMKKDEQHAADRQHRHDDKETNEEAAKSVWDVLRFLLDWGG